MLQFTPDNYKYHTGLRAAMKLLPDAQGSLTDSQRAQLTQLYDGLQQQYPRSSAAKRVPLDFKVCVNSQAVCGLGESLHSCAYICAKRCTVVVMS